MMTILALALVAQDTLPPIVVTATRSPAPVSTIASAVTVLDGAALRQAGITTLADALRSVPGVALAQAGSYGAQTSLFMRGGESDYVRVLLDGVPINQAGGFIDLANLGIENVERIEIVRGPASVLYGSDAVTGVVQVITRRGDRGGVIASARAGSFGTTQLGADLALAGARVDLSGGMHYGITDGVYAFNNRYGRSGGSGRLAWRPDGRTDVALTARGFVSTFRYPTDGSGAAVDSNQVQRSRALTLSLDAGRRVSDALELRLLAGLHAQRDSIDDRQDHPGDTLDFTYAYESRARTGRRGADLRAIVQVRRGWTVTAGAALDREHEDSRNSYQGSFGPGSGTTNVARTNRALYTQLAGGAGRLSLQAGVRIDDNQRFGAFTTWRAGATARVAAGTRVRGSFGTAFKEPTFIEHYSTGFSTGNPDLDPERSTSWEVGIAQQLARGRLHLSASWFDQRFRDMIQYSFTPAPGDSANFYNVASATARGLELEARALPGDFVIGAQYTRLTTSARDSGFDGLVFDEGQRLVRRPTHGASVSADWRGIAGLVVGARTLYVGGRDDIDFNTFSRVTLPEYVRIDLHAEAAVWRRAGRYAALSLRVDNVTGEQYQEFFGFPAPGRRLLAGLRVAGDAAAR